MNQTSDLDGDQSIAGELRDYIYGISHDVGAPVRAMVEFSRLLSEEYGKDLDEEGRLYLSLIVENGKKLQNMMAGLLEFSRLNTEAQPFTAVKCEDVIRNCMALLADKITASGARMEVEPLPEVMADAGQITRLFTALLDNALKFQPQGVPPRVKIAAAESGDFWKFTVSDNGIGINERFQKKIFRIFQRLHADGDYPGIGVGLALAQRIVQRHGGEIRVESAPNHGAAFLFTIPKR